jgi:hypothetical protein
VRFRYLHPGLGRWVSRDILEYIDSMSTYMYGLSSVPNYVDPTGLYVEGAHHWYPRYLGGHPTLQITTKLSKPIHHTVTAYWKTHFPYGGSGAAKWAGLSNFQQMLHIAKTMKMAGLDKAARRAMVPQSFTGATPGVSQSSYKPKGLGGAAIGAALIILTSPSVADAATTDNDRFRTLHELGFLRRWGGEGNPWTGCPTSCPPDAVQNILEGLDGCLQDSIWEGEIEVPGFIWNSTKKGTFVNWSRALRCVETAQRLLDLCDRMHRWVDDYEGD